MTDAPENPLPADDLQALWQAQTPEISPMLLADVHKRAQGFETLQLWNLIAFALIAAFGVGLAGWVMLNMNDGMLSVGYSLVALGVLFALYYRHNRNPAGAQALASASHACFDFYRDMLKRRIQLARTAWAWAMLPLVPGVLIIVCRIHQKLMAADPHLPLSADRTVWLGAFLVVALAVRTVMQQGRARRLERELATIEAGATTA